MIQHQSCMSPFPTFCCCTFVQTLLLLTSAVSLIINLGSVSRRNNFARFALGKLGFEGGQFDCEGEKVVVRDAYSILMEMVLVEK